VPKKTQPRAHRTTLVWKAFGASARENVPAGPERSLEPNPTTGCAVGPSGYRELDRWFTRQQLVTLLTDPTDPRVDTGFGPERHVVTLDEAEARIERQASMKPIDWAEPKVPGRVCRGFVTDPGVGKDAGRPLRKRIRAKKKGLHWLRFSHPLLDEREIEADALRFSGGSASFTEGFSYAYAVKKGECRYIEKPPNLGAERGFPIRSTACRGLPVSKASPPKLEKPCPAIRRGRRPWVTIFANPLLTSARSDRRGRFDCTG